MAAKGRRMAKEGSMVFVGRGFGVEVAFFGGSKARDVWIVDVSEAVAGAFEYYSSFFVGTLSASDDFLCLA